MVNYENMILLGDFNSIVTENTINDFGEMCSLINEPTCYKNANNPAFIDLILTNWKRGFHNSMTIETGRSDHHKMTVPVLKFYFRKKEHGALNYRSYRKMNENLFRRDLINLLQNGNFWIYMLRWKGNSIIMHHLWTKRYPRRSYIGLNQKIILTKENRR